MELRHDGFARQTLIKESPGSEPCKWCGNKDGNGRTWVYYWRPDDQLGHTHPRHTHPRYTNFSRFCSVSCAEIYHS
jgi:hypothetical protein